jgi:hypothetical protein
MAWNRGGTPGAGRQPEIYASPEVFLLPPSPHPLLRWGWGGNKRKGLLAKALVVRPQAIFLIYLI